MIESLLIPGTMLLGKFRVERVLGRGAMGVVVAATNVALGQRVALKFMLPGKGPTPERDARFLREARIAARLTSQHVAKVLDVGTMEATNLPYLVMEHLDGQDLDAVLEERGPLPIAEAVSYILQVCEAVAEAHKAGIVHRDLKPANLFLVKLADGSPCVKVLDFGVSKLTEPGAALTMEAAVLGSPLYMSPEQMQASKDVDARSDIWALGIVLYQLVVNLTPFHGDVIQQVCARVFHGEPTPLSTFRADVPAGFEAVLLHCFEKDRERRWPNVAEFAAALVPFGPARSVVHAERAAAILGVTADVPRLTELLPPDPVVVAPPLQALALSAERTGGTLDTGAELAAGSRRPAPSSKRFVAAGLGLGVLVMGALTSVGLSRLRGDASVTPELGSGATTAIASAIPLATSQPPIVPLSSSSVVLPSVASAAPSATVVVAAPKPSAVRLPPRPTSSAKTIPVPGKGTILDRD
jgi:serine/threonine-protein kinase